MTEILAVIDMIGAKLATIAFLIVVFKFIFIRLQYTKMDDFFKKVHKPAAWFLVGFAVIHGLAALHVFGEAPLFVYILGVLSLCAAILSIGTHVFQAKFGEGRLKWHRIFACITFVLFVLHLVFGFWAYFQL